MTDVAISETIGNESKAAGNDVSRRRIAKVSTNRFRSFFTFMDFDKAIPPYLLRNSEFVSPAVPKLDDIPTACSGHATYDSEVAELLAFASAWAYADPSTFAFMMSRRGLRNWRCLCLKIENDPLLLAATAYLLQSAERDVAILVFRGTEPTNIVNWMTDLSISPERFIEGRVHGGIFRNLQALWPLVHTSLRLIESGDDLDEENAILKENFSDVRDRLQLAAAEGMTWTADGERPNALAVSADRSSDSSHPGAKTNGHPYKDQKRSSRLKALYLTGHSLGGAMASLAAAEIWMDARYKTIREQLCGVYTYGAPMVAVPELADVLEKDLGHFVFRHVYDKDIVPRLPPFTSGSFKHFGKEYRSNGGGNGWEFRKRYSSQVLSFSSVAVGAIAWVAEQIPLLRNVRLPVSWDHHSPRYYMKISGLSRSERL